MLPVNDVLIIKSMNNVIILWVRWDDPLFRRPDLFFLFCRRGRHEACVDQLKYIILRHCTVKKNRDPVHLIHVVGRHDAIFADEHIPEEHIVDLQIDHIDPFITFNSQFILLYRHDKREPFFIVSMPEDRVPVVRAPGVFRQGFVFLFYVSKYCITIHHSPLYDAYYRQPLLCVRDLPSLHQQHSLSVSCCRLPG